MHHCINRIPEIKFEVSGLVSFQRTVADIIFSLILPHSRRL